MQDIRKVFLFFMVTMFVHPAWAQHQEINTTPAIWTGTAKKESNDSISLLQAFQKGHFNGHFRYYFMATDNAHQLTDYYANAIGGGLKFETADFHHFRFGISGFYIFNIGSSNLVRTDAVTNQTNRYEVGLFDIADPSNKSNIDRLEELYIRYQFKNNKLIFGKQLINTPFINLQDGRMRPTEIAGLWTEIKALQKLKVEGGYIYKISPRSTTAFYSIANSIGIYSVGVNPDGTKSGYKSNLKSKGILVAGVSNPNSKLVKFQLWNQFVENIFNSTLVQVDFKKQVENKSNLLFGVQSVFQHSIKNGGNSDLQKSYFGSKNKSLTYGLKLGWERNNLETSLNYNRITTMGRYLMPREWGRDPFFTFLPRERNEGLADVHAITCKAGYTMLKEKLKTSLALGYYNLPSVKEVQYNKYGMPSYTQMNLDIRYFFSGFLKGMDMQFLLMHKWNQAKEALQEKYLFNKVKMTHVNLILNFRF